MTSIVEQVLVQIEISLPPRDAYSFVEYGQAIYGYPSRVIHKCNANDKVRTYLKLTLTSMPSYVAAIAPWQSTTAT